MPLLPIIDTALKIAEKTLEFSTLKLEGAPQERVRSLRLRILEERNKGEMGDQALIGKIYEQLEVELLSIDSQIMQALARKG